MKIYEDSTKVGGSSKLLHVAWFVSVLRQGLGNCHPSWSSKDSLKRGKRVCNRQNCEVS